jgi:hypothetical protein
MNTLRVQRYSSILNSFFNKNNSSRTDLNSNLAAECLPENYACCFAC